jgi:hypothetical protein
VSLPTHSSGSCRTDGLGATFVSNGPTQPVNNFVNRIMLIGFGFRRPRPLPHPCAALRAHAQWDLVLIVTPC